MNQTDIELLIDNQRKKDDKKMLMQVIQDLKY